LGWGWNTPHDQLLRLASVVLLLALTRQLGQKGCFPSGEKKYGQLMQARGLAMKGRLASGRQPADA
jgi:hypothetical protein